jgi:hypothetical protein
MSVENLSVNDPDQPSGDRVTEQTSVTLPPPVASDCSPILKKLEDIEAILKRMYGHTLLAPR